ncbi:MAG: hypothetical protein OXS47_03030 [Chloroflexota bacterium]|nr:hypothetical protein [Chloroflexota bacterium]
MEPPARIAIRDIAAEAGVHRQTVHKIVKRLRIETTKEKSADARGQRVSCVSWADYERIINEFQGRSKREKL